MHCCLLSQAISASMNSLRNSLHNMEGTSVNFLDMSSDAGLMGDQLLLAVNRSISILERTNDLAGQILSHPTITMALGQGR